MLPRVACDDAAPSCTNRGRESRTVLSLMRTNAIGKEGIRMAMHLLLDVESKGMSVDRGKQLKAIRMGAGVTAVALAKRAKIRKSRVWNAENLPNALSEQEFKRLVGIIRKIVKERTDFLRSHRT